MLVRVAQSIWKSVIVFHFMNSNVMRGNEFNAGGHLPQRVDLSSVLCYPATISSVLILVSIYK